MSDAGAEAGADPSDDTDAVDLSGRWRLHPRVSLRPEPFGALAYHYDNRRLNFLRSPDLVELVRSLEHHDNPRAAFDAHDLADRRWPSFARALTALARSDFIQPVENGASDGQSAVTPPPATAAAVATAPTAENR